MSTVTYEQARADIVENGRWMDARGWAPATAGNYSIRLSDGSFAMTVSGVHKGRLSEDDVMRVDGEARALDGKRPSAEALLHVQLYRLYPEAGAVLHGHSPGAVALSRVLRDRWTIAGHELLKVIPGLSTHDTEIEIPIVDNSQNMIDIKRAIEPRLLALASPHAYLIRGHGLYAWGKDLAEAQRVVEGVEWLVEAEIVERALRVGMERDEPTRGVSRG